MKVKGVSYNIGSLGAGATWSSEWLDIEALSPYISEVIITKNGIASAGEMLDIKQSPDGQTDFGRLCLGNRTNLTANNPTSAANMAVAGVAALKYVKVQFINGSTAQAALKITIGLHRR